MQSYTERGVNIPLLITDEKTVGIEFKHLSLNESCRGGLHSKRRDSAIPFHFQMLAAHSFPRLRLPNKLDASRSTPHSYKLMKSRKDLNPFS